MIFVNFKTYKESTGENSLNLIKVIEALVREEGVKIIPVVQASDIKEAVEASKLEIWTQKIDAVGYGAHTGAILPEAVFEDGALGTFLNHSESKFTDFDTLSQARARAQDVGLKTLIFASDMTELRKVVALNPDFVAYEPPELVGSKDTSVAKEKPEIIKEAVDIAKENKLPLVVGAGIKSREDVKKSLELGAVGVAVASSVILAQNPKEELLTLIEGFK